MTPKLRNRTQPSATNEVKVNGDIVSMADSSDTEEHYEIDHDKEEEEDDDNAIVSNSSTEEEDDDLADQIEMIGDKFEEAFSSKPKETDSVLKSDEYFLAQSSKSKVSKQSFTSVLENFDLYEADINEIIQKEHQQFCKEFNIDTSFEKEFEKFFHFLK